MDGPDEVAAMNTVKVGRVVALAGYDVLAMAQCDHGSVVVINNNSSHFIVVACDEAAESIVARQERIEGVVAAMYTYALGSDSSREAYRLALAKMAAVAIQNVEDDDRSDDDGSEDLSEDYPGQRITGPDSSYDDCPCPGCGCVAGEGRTPGCTHEDGCGYWEALERDDRETGGETSCPKK
jgi:hypothetical protein